ncbi:MAG: Rho-binding antiterminator [Gammaproteobacteria bacterium]
MNSTIISCDLHDYVEIACMYGYRLRLVFKNGETMEGKARDIANVDKKEYLLVDDGSEQRIDLTRIAKMQVLTPHSKFKEVSF